MLHDSLSNQSFIPNIIFDSITIGFCTITVTTTLLCTGLIVFRRRFSVSKERIPILLSINMYVSVCAFAVCVLNMTVAMLKGHLYSNETQANDHTRWCYTEAYLTNVAMLWCLYSSTLHGLYRFCRIVYYSHRILRQNLSLYVIGVLVQILLSALQTLPILLTGVYHYDDYHCQIPLTNWANVMLATALIWVPPLSITTTIYLFTVRYIRRNAALFTYRQHTRITRDVTVIKRIVWSVVFVVLCAMPAFSITIMYYLFAYFGWWGNHLAWLGFILSFTGMSVVHTWYSPHLRNLWPRAQNRISHATTVTRLNLR